MALLIVIVVMLVAVALLIVVVVMLVAMALLIVIVVMLVAVALLVVIVMMVMVVLMLLLKSGKSISESILALDSGKNVRAGEIVPGGGNYNRVGVQLAEHCNTFLDLMRLCALGMREDDGRGVRNLITVKFAEVLQVHLALIHVSNGGEAVELCTMLLCRACRTDNVRELSNS